MPGDVMDGGAHPQIVESAGHCIFRRDFISSPTEIRKALLNVTRALEGGVAPDDLGSIQIVLAEIFNNICQHGYTKLGRISVQLLSDACGFTCRVVDGGKAPPPHFFDAKFADPICVPAEDLPTNGFGGYLIRGLAPDICYERSYGWNIITFDVTITV